MKKLLSVLLIFATLCLILVGCKPSGNDEPQDEDEKKKYDVSMKIVIEGIGEYIFTPDIDRITVTIPYDGVKREVYLAGYQYVDHPDKSHRESWLAPKFTGGECFGRLMKFKDENGERDLYDYEIKERGEYWFYCYVGTTSQLWEFRTVRLIIVVE